MPQREVERFERVVLSAPMISLPSHAKMSVAGPFARIFRMFGGGKAFVPSSKEA